MLDITLHVDNMQIGLAPAYQWTIVSKIRNDQWMFSPNGSDQGTVLKIDDVYSGDHIEKLTDKRPIITF